MTLNKLKEILGLESEVIRNKNMISIHMSKEEFKKVEVCEDYIIQDGEVIIKACIEN